MNRSPEDVYKGKANPELPLFPQAPTRRGSRATSFAAAASVRNITQTHDAIVQVFRAYGGMTDEQLLARYEAHRVSIGSDYYPKASPSGIRSRRAELCRLGIVVDSGKRGETAAGRECVIWKLK